MKLKYLKQTTKETLEEHNKYLKSMMFDEVYKHLICGTYFSGFKETDGWNSLNFDILTESGDVIGLVRLSINRGTNIHSINGLYVEKKYIGEGYGKKAMLELIEFSKTRFTRLELETTSKKLVKFYKSLGFKQVGKFTKRVILTDYKSYDEYLMELIF